ncbi:MAG: cell division protein FtsZ [Thermoplasmata archaeon]
MVSMGYNEYGDFSRLSVYVVGVGGGGNNSINRLSRMGITGAETIAVNTDREHLENIMADNRVLIGAKHNKGLGAGGSPKVGEDCAQCASGGFNNMFKDADLIFVTAGMGGGTGTGAAPVITEIARRRGSMVIAILTMPFSFEGKMRRNYAIKGVKKIQSYANSTIILENDKLLKVVSDLPMDEAFGVMDALISDLIKSVTETVTCPSLINLDFNDLRSVLETGGVSTLMKGESSIDEPLKAVEEASSNPFLSVDYTGAKKALIHVTGGPDMNLQKMNDVVTSMTSKLDPNAGVIFGARIDPLFKNKIKLMSIITGLKSSKKLRRDPRMSFSTVS